MKVSQTNTRIWVYLTKRNDTIDTTTNYSQRGNSLFPAWERFIPNVGTIYSQRGNNQFFVSLAMQNL